MNELFRLRITFAKHGRLRWLSHLELTRAMERLVRRSGLPFAVSQGFSPHMRFAVGPALPVGTAGLGEKFDVWLTDYVDAKEALALLQAAAGDTLGILGTEYVPGKDKGLQAVYTINRYEVVVEVEAVNELELQAALDEISSREQIEVVHKKSTKVFELAQVIVDAPVVVARGSTNQSVGADPGNPHPDGLLPSQFLIRCTLRNLPDGSLRPEQLINQAMAKWRSDTGDASDTGSVRIISVTRIALEHEPAD